jgi:hypothetical protein
VINSKSVMGSESVKRVDLNAKPPLSKSKQRKLKREADVAPGEHNNENDGSNQKNGSGKTVTPFFSDFAKFEKYFFVYV